MAVRLFVTGLGVLCLLASSARAQDPILSDTNGDGVVQVLALGDSVTYGVGDGIAPNLEVEDLPDRGAARGYPSRLSRNLSLPVTNSGEPGEELTIGGVTRAPGVIQSTSADEVVFLWGYNDAFFQISPGHYREDLQRLVNIARVTGKQSVLVTLHPSCCDRGGLTGFTRQYSNEVRSLAAWNDLPLFDLEALWNQRCPNKDSCPLINRPEGLHPNTLGYDFIGYGLSATLLGLPLAVPEDAVALADAIGADPARVTTVLFGGAAVTPAPATGRNE